ncbi:arsenical pump-driving ATPase [Roseiconus lacunae]|uniref:arsenical pump-driving ATPase n=1 Tax=Roseiconus lacunae TaxID=2605694 RepID=UPI001E3F914F|nr:arsenical pump-driving ATPase [Roseiconus lacunae]MCD0457992.1 arsenical pump-driving ATPase [Roseiconus lacunae]
MRFLEHPTRHLFFTGKGGVGKTSMSCASAVSLADAGRRVLLVSTDPASNLDEVLGTTLSGKPTPVRGVDHLWAMNIDPEQAAADYRERMVRPYRGVLPEAAIENMEEQFSGSCTLEIAAFDEFAKLLGDEATTSDFDHIVFDTAPTGHTLRLLTLPSAWSGYIESNTSGTSCIGPLAGLQEQQRIYQATKQRLGDASETTLVLVTRPEPSALQEAQRTSEELRSLGVNNQHLVINGTFKATDPSDPIAIAMQLRCAEAIDNLPKGLVSLEQTSVRLASGGLIGINALRQIRGLGTDAENDTAPSDEVKVSSGPMFSMDGFTSFRSLVDQFAEQRHGVIMTMGKGGVGKTSVAAAVAVALAERGLKVHLSTTDPAAHLQSALADEGLDGLSISRIDPAEVTNRYRREVMQTAGADLDEQGKALLDEDLRSPCTEEIAVFRAFAESIAEGKDGIVVLDTAPTGHTVLLLDSALAYHREVTRQSSQMPESVEELLPRLRDPDFTRILVVTLPESTPVHEAASLQRDLRRAEIEPYAWVINQSLSPLPLRDPTLVGRQRNEQSYLNEVRSLHSKRTVLVPWHPVQPTGIAGLRRFVAPVKLKQEDTTVSIS